MGQLKHALLIGVNNNPQFTFHPCRKIRIPYKPLLGCENDVDLMRGVLLSFGFSGKHIRILKTAQATRQAILTAVDDLVGRVGRDDIVVLYYSGHGSRLRNLDNLDQTWETIAPYDTSRRGIGFCEMVPQLSCSDGRSLEPPRWRSFCGPQKGGTSGPDENRDIKDVEINSWVERLNEKTPNVTLIFDCCHSGSITRDPFGEAVREVVEDLRPASEAFGEDLGGGRRSLVGDTEILEGRPRIRSGWLPVGTNAVVVAACRAVEKSSETKPEDGTTSYGLLTYHLAQVLTDVGSVPGEKGRNAATWRDVLERVAPRVSAEVPAQHPQIEGQIEQLVFGTEKARAGSHLTVNAVQDEEVELWGGTAHGVSRRSLWSIRPHGTRGRSEGDELARLRIEQVRPATSRGRIVAGTEEGPLEAGQRAFLLEQDLSEPGLKVAIAAPGDRVGKVAEALAGSELLTVVSEDVTVRCLAPRERVGPDDPCPYLGPLEEWTWAVVGRDGRLWARLRSDDDAGVESLREDLVKLARFGGLRRLENPDGESGLRERVDLRILVSSAPGTLLEEAQRDEEYGVVVVEEGDKVDFEIENRYDKEIWISLVELDSDHSISVLMPRPGWGRFRRGGKSLQPGDVLRVGRDYYEVDGGLEQGLPDGFPWPAEEGERQEVGFSYLKLLVTLVPASFEFLEQEDTRFEPRNRLQGLAWLYHSSLGTRRVLLSAEETAKDDDWTVVTRELGIRRRFVT